MGKDFTTELFSELTLLVADDEQLTAREMERILEKRFKKIYTANDGKEALELFDDKKIDIIISDINMPKLTGLELAKKVKNKNKNVPIIIVTAYSEIEYLYEAIEIGVEQFIHKPVDPRKLFGALEKCAHIISVNRIIKEREATNLKSAIYGAKKELLKDISHHWRNPLQVLVGVVDIFEEMGSYSDDEFLQNRGMLVDYCGKARNTLDKMAFSLKSFIKFIDGRHQEKVLSVKNTFEMSWRFCEESFNSLDCKLDIDLDEGVQFYADEPSVNFSIYQILKNSFEEFERKGIKEPKIRVYSDVVDDVRTVYICDNAGGISKEIEPKLFEPYVSDKGIESGRGVGLFLSKKIFAENGYKLDIENDRGKGICAFIKEIGGNHEKNRSV